LRAAGAGRLTTFAYGIRPLAARSVLSFTLMRAECAIRNAAVIGVVGGGGLGSELMLRLGYGELDKVATLLLFTLALTFTADLASSFLRRQLRNDPNHPRAARNLSRRAQLARTWVAAAAVAGAIAWAAHHVGGGNEEGRNHLAPLVALLDGEAWARLAFFKDLLRPELTREAVWDRSIVAAVVPLSMAVVGTVAGTLLAILLAYPHSVAFQVEPHHFTGETPSAAARAGRFATALAARALGLVARAVPEVLWALIFVSFFGLGVAPGMVAIAVHSVGVLVRVFTETVDNIPYRRFEQAFSGSRAATFAYAAAPISFRDWMTYAFFQLESNVRAGVVLGIVGVGGLGFNFAFNFEWFRHERAATNLLAIILLTVAIDRLSRFLKLARPAS
jgi:phosphonate transport system permease protein